MKVKKVLILLTVMCLCGGTMIFADAASQRVRVIVNGAELQDGGLLTEGQTYLPLRQLADAVNALITWDVDSKKVTMNKPNVHMFLFQDKTIFGKVNQGNKYTFSVFAQVDSLYTNISGVKIAVADPSGKEELIDSQAVTEQKDNFWFRTKELKYNFAAAGNYTVKFYMKPSASTDWSLVSQKLIIAE